MVACRLNYLLLQVKYIACLVVNEPVESHGEFIALWTVGSITNVPQREANSCIFYLHIVL